MRMMKGRRKRRWICEGVVGAAVPLAAGKREAEERREREKTKTMKKNWGGVRFRRQKRREYIYIY